MNSFKYLTAPHCAKAVDFCKNLSHALHFCAETAKKRIVPRADLPVILCAVYSSIQFQRVKKEQTYPVCLSVCLSVCKDCLRSLHLCQAIIFSP